MSTTVELLPLQPWFHISLSLGNRLYYTPILSCYKNKSHTFPELALELKSIGFHSVRSIILCQSNVVLICICKFDFTIDLLERMEHGFCN